MEYFGRNAILSSNRLISLLSKILKAALTLFFMALPGLSRADLYYGPPWNYNGPVMGANGVVVTSSFTYDIPGTADRSMQWQRQAYGYYFTSCKGDVIYGAAPGYTNNEVAARLVIGPEAEPSCRPAATYYFYNTAYAYDPIKNAGSGSTGGASEDCGCAASGSPMAGDPINAFSGNKFFVEKDFKGDGWLDWNRFYNSSRAAATGGFGPHWRHSFERSLLFVPSAAQPYLYVLRPDGSGETFRKINGQWTTDADTADTLVEQGSGYRLFIASSRQTEVYSKDGLLQTIQEASGPVTSLTYSDGVNGTDVAAKAGLLLTVTDPFGRSLKFSYDSANRITEVTLPDASVLHYSYNGAGFLAQATAADGASKQYLYDESDHVPSDLSTYYPGSLSGVIDEKGVRYQTNDYDYNGHTTQSQSAGGVDLTHIIYGWGATEGQTASGIQNALGGLFVMSFQQPLGRVKSSAIDRSCNPLCGRTDAAMTYDANGYPASKTDFLGNLTTTVYSTQGLLTEQVDASGQAGQRTTRTSWDATLRVPLRQVTTDAAGSWVSERAWVYNARGQAQLACTYGAAALSGSTCVAGQARSDLQSTSFTYCDQVDAVQCPLIGLLLTTDGPRTDVNDITHYSYYLSTDESGCGTLGGACHRAGDLYQVTDALGHTTTAAAYDKAGRLLRQIDAAGVPTDYSYTPRGWLQTRTVRAAATGVSSTDATTTIDYDAVGNVIKLTEPDGVFTRYTYDAAHRLTDITDALGNVIHYSLDAAGDKTAETVTDAQGQVRRSLTRSFNNLGQLISVTDGLGHTTFHADAAGDYDGNGNLVHSADALGVQHQQGYDGLNRLVRSVRNYNGTDSATQNTTTAMTYDALDQLRSVTDPDGLVTSYAVDGLGNLTGQQSPDTGSRSASYDAAGNPVSLTDAKGVTQTRSFDALNRLTGISYPTASQQISYRYDEANSITACTVSYPVGRLTRIIENGVTTSFCYDQRGNVLRKRQVYAGHTDDTSYAYSLGDRLQGVTSPSGTHVGYSLDTDGRVTAISLSPFGGGAANAVSNVSYLPFGPLASYTLGNGQTVTRAYDANYALSDVTSPVLGLHFSRDAMGNITGATDEASATSQSYTYDPLYRLTAMLDAQATPIESYTYSKTGDRLSKIGGTLANGDYGYASGTHHLSSIGNATRAYDANGSTTGSVLGGSVYGYAYNDRGRLSLVQRDGSTVGNYVYNALGERVSKNTTLPSSSTTRFAYDEASHLLGEYGDTSRDYVWLGDLPIAVVDGTAATPVVDYVHADGLGTPRAVTNGAGAAVWQWPYLGNPFGEQAPQGLNGSGFVLSLRYPGQYYDAESGLNYNVHRYYESAIGGYDQPDPSGLAAGPSLFAYVGGNPLRYVDPLGLQAENERDLLEPIDVAGPINAAAYRDVFGQIRQYDPDFEDPVMSRAEPTYTRTDVARLEDVLRGKVMEGCRAPSAGTRRPQSPGDRQFPTQSDALAEALRRHGIDPSTAEVTPMYGKNPNLVGPNGEPWQIISGLDPNGELIQFQNHSNGHSFSDAGEFELPHYHGPNGEHLSY